MSDLLWYVLAFAVLAGEESPIWLAVRRTLGPVDFEALNEPTDPATILAAQLYR
jgi:hypothetical protein